MVTLLKKTSDNVYYAQKDDGEVIAENSSSPNTVIQTALDQRGRIDFDDVNFDTTSGFAGFKLKSHTRITGSRLAKIRVPSGYTGDVFLLDTTYDSGVITNINFDGLRFEELGAVSYNWNGFHFLSNGANHGIFQTNIQNTEVYFPSKAVLLESAHLTGWINDIGFESVFSHGSRVGWEWKKDAVANIPYNNINRVNLRRCTHQTSGNTQYGVKAVDGEGHFFDDFRVYDIQLSTQPNVKISQFLSTANKIVILQGAMTHANPIYLDWACPEGNITIIDPFYTPVIRELRASKFTTFVPTEGIYTWPSSNDGKTRVYNIPHGQGGTPTTYAVFPVTKDAAIGPFQITGVDSTNITISYLSTLPPPTTPSNTNNLKWYWRARV